MSVLFDVIAQVLAFLYNIIPNYAMAITLLTVLVMAITTPLTLKSTRSMMMMQQLQPEMKKIQARYKDDREKQNEELLKFYRENNINPLGGCVPLLVQFPVFIVLYNVLRGLTRRISDVGFPSGFVTGQNGVASPLSNPPHLLSNFDPAYLDHNSAMYQSLSSTNTMSGLGMDLSQSLADTWSRGIVASLPYIILIAIVAFSSFYQQRQIQGRNPNAQISSQQQTLMKIMPIILPLISINLPAGLVLYFAVSNLWRVGLQAFISRSIYGMKRGEKPAGGKKDQVQPKPAKGSTKAAVANGKNQKAGAGRNGKGGVDTADEPTSKAADRKTRVPADAGTNGARKSASSQKATRKPAASAKPKDTTRKNASTPKSRSQGANPPASNQTLQPRARRPKKR